MIGTCEAADPNSRRPSFAVPSDAVDCHAHIFGPYDTYPLAPDRTYTPPTASLVAYLKLLGVLGISRGVLVQPSVYGFDNSCLINALKVAGKQFRGVAVVSPDCEDDELERLHEAGIRGLRINIVFGSGASMEAARTLSQRIKCLGWHLQILVDVSQFTGLTQFVRSLQVPVVIDHMGHVPADIALNNSGFLELLELLGEQECWVKLSGSYRMTRQTIPPYSDIVSIAKALVSAGPTRCVWATDWPHPKILVPMPNDGDLIDQLETWIPDAATRHRVLVDNPVHLYGFE